MRLNVDPIQASRQVREVKASAARAANNPEGTDQEKINGRAGYFVFTNFMIFVAGELRNDVNPMLLPGAAAEIIGKMAAALVETVFEDEDHEKALFSLMGASHAVAQSEIAASKARAAAEANAQPKEN